MRTAPWKPREVSVVSLTRPVAVMISSIGPRRMIASDPADGTGEAIGLAEIGGTLVASPGSLLGGPGVHAVCTRSTEIRTILELKRAARCERLTFTFGQ